MRIFMSVDMEGITGVSSGAALSASGYEYDRFRRLMTEDVNAAVEGAILGGADEVVVGDAHGTMNNIMIEHLHEKARLISGSNKQLCQMGGIEDYPFDGVMFVGYHGGEGSRGVVNHTVMGVAVTQITVNGKWVGETTLNAGMAGHFGLPVILVTGDDVVTAEATENLDHPEICVVKKAKDRFCADCLPPKVTHPMIKEAARRAVERLKRGEFKPYKVQTPVSFDVTFKTTAETTFCTLFPTIQPIDTKTVRITADDYVTGYKQLWGCLVLGRAAQGGVFK